MQITFIYNFIHAQIHRSSKKKRRRREERGKKETKNTKLGTFITSLSRELRYTNRQPGGSKKKKKKPIHDVSRAKVTEVLRSRGKKSEQYTDNPNNTCRRKRKKSRETWRDRREREREPPR